MPPRLSVHYSDASRYAAPVVIFLLLLSVGAEAAEKDMRPSAKSTLTEQAEQRVIALTNELRSKNALAPLAAEARLTETARNFSAHLAKTGKLDHDADGSTPAERVKQRGYSYCMVAENLASEYRSNGFTADELARNVVTGWSESPSHRANMLQSDLTQIGVGISREPKDGEYFVVQIFGRPLGQPVKFSVTNRSNAAVRYEYRDRPLSIGAKQTRTHESCAGG